MVKLGTSCTDCLHFNIESKTCTKGLHQIFKDRGSDLTYLDDDVAIDRICPHKLLQDQKSSEVYIFGTIVLITNNLGELKNTLQKLKSNEHIHNFKILVLYSDIKYHEILPVCIENIEGSYKLIKMLTNDKAFQVYKAISFAKNGLLFILECSKEFDENIIDKIDNMINRKLYRLLHVHHNGEMHQSVSMLHVYKWIKGDLGQAMSFKLNDIASQENSDSQVYTWKEVNEQYST